MRASSFTPAIIGHMGRDGRHVLLACAVLAFIFAVAFTIGIWSGVLTMAPSAAVYAAPGRPAELNTGRIVFATSPGKLCRQMLIDNDTWHVTESGAVDCAVVDPPSSARPLAPVGAERFLGLRGGFRGKD